MIEAPSKNRVRRAGERIIAAHQNGDEWPADDVDVVVAWRSAHAEPVEWLAESARRRTDQPVSYRLKRLPQIVAKLVRQRNMGLDRMQDLAGYRIVVDTNDDVDEVVADVTGRAKPHYEVRDTDDYRATGRAHTGYRAVHLILQREGRLVELQVRSRRQHGWAEAVERAANRTGFPLKDGDGPTEVVGYFRVASDVLAALDAGNEPTPDQVRELRALEPSLHEYLRPPTPGEEHFRLSAPKTASQAAWILVYDWKTGKRLHWRRAGPSPVAAARQFADWERQYSDHEVVLIGSDSEKTVAWTHAHYFGRNADDLDPHGVLAELAAV